MTSLKLSDQNGLPDLPMVSVICLTYQHVNFIKDALEGFLMQEVTFGVEVLVHDDASQDGTREIVADYAVRYPGVFRVTLQAENQFSQGVRVGGLLTSQAKGKYLAFCEGDDYWTDPQKLAKQVHYMETHPDCVMTGHATQILDMAKGQMQAKRKPAPEERSLSAAQLRALVRVPRNCTRVFRRVDTSDAPERNKILAGDAFLQSLLGQHGYYHFLPDISPSVYRVHPKGVWSKLTLGERLHQLVQLHNALSAFYTRQGDRRTARAVARRLWIARVRIAAIWLKQRVLPGRVSN